MGSKTDSAPAPTYWRGISAMHAMASLLGVLAGLGNLGYGIIEILQGNTKPVGIVVSAFMTPSGASRTTEPAIIVFLISGISLVAVSIFFTIWSASFVQKKRGGLIMIILSVVQIVVGGSTVRSIQGIIFGIIGTRIDAGFTWWRARFSERSRQLMSSFWPWLFLGCAFLYLVHIGSAFVDFFIGINSPAISLILLAVPSYGNLLLFVLALIAGLAHDSLEAGANVFMKS